MDRASQVLVLSTLHLIRANLKDFLHERNTDTPDQAESLDLKTMQRQMRGVEDPLLPESVAVSETEEAEKVAGQADTVQQRREAGRRHRPRSCPHY